TGLGARRAAKRPRRPPGRRREPPHQHHLPLGMDELTILTAVVASLKSIVRSTLLVSLHGATTARSMQSLEISGTPPTKSEPGARSCHPSPLLPSTRFASITPAACDTPTGSRACTTD